MSSLSRVDALEKLLLFDHKTRGRMMLMMVVSGVLSRVVWELLSPGSDAFTSAQILVAGAVMLTVFVARWLTYDLGRAGIVEPLGWRETAYTRRDLLTQFTGGAIVLAAAATPAAAESTLLDKRIARLLGSGRNAEAARLTQRAVAADYSLSPSIASSATLPSTSSFTNHDVSLPAKLRFGSRVLRIQLPILHLDYVGPVPVRGNLNLRSVTCSGNGPDVTRILFDPDGQPGNSVLFSYTDELRTDAVIMRLRAEVSGAARNMRASFLSLSAVTHQVAVYDVHVIGLQQDLDGVLWDTVRFTSCEITCGSQPFKLINVVFDDCSFRYADSVPVQVRQQLEREGVPVSGDFN